MYFREMAFMKSIFEHFVTLLNLNSKHLMTLAQHLNLVRVSFGDHFPMKLLQNLLMRNTFMLTSEKRLHW